jgi:hypothetical protein
MVNITHFKTNPINTTMKKLLLILATVFTTVISYSQTLPAPSSGHWVIVDTTYDVGTTTVGATQADLYYNNSNTPNNITGLQFRVFYDKVAFGGLKPTVSLNYSPTSQYLQYVSDSINGHITVTLVYTGTNPTFSYGNGAAVKINFTHAAPAIWNTLDSIKTLKVVGTQTFNNLAATNLGNDTTLSLYSYGGQFLQQTLKFKGTFLTTNGSGAKNLTLALEKKPKTGSTWTQVNTYTTNLQGKFNFTVTLDTTYWDTRIAVKGDTMGVGNIISTADAQKINQTVLSQYTPLGFDFYTMDVNGSNSVTITDAYAVFSKIAGNFPNWPNNVQDLLFFTPTEYATINGASTNYTSTISGVTNFTHYINGGVDSVIYYIAVKGDANNTGYNMARLTPIPIVVPEKAPQYVIDNTVKYDNVVDSIEINMPKVNVEAGNLVNIPVKVLTNGKPLSALQLYLKYDDDLLEFKKVINSEKAMRWMTYLNPSNGVVAWGGFDITNENLLNDGEQAFTLQFVAKQPQNQWTTAALWTSDKYVGDYQARDLNITPAMGIVEVKKIVFKPKVDNSILDLKISPNPSDGNYLISFNLVEDGITEVALYDVYGKKLGVLVNELMPAGEYLYSAKFLVQGGMYYTTVTNNGKVATNKTVILK